MAINFPHTGIFDEKEDANALVFNTELFKKRVLVTGANGQLGNELRILANEYNEYTFDFTDVAELDLCDADAVRLYCENTQPAYIINCAAYTAVEKAEDEEVLARKINRDAVENLAKAAQAVGAILLHVSTDYVFDGSATSPYLETDPVCPVSVYGQTKLEGELAVAEFCPKHIILRTAWLYSEFGNNFVKTMIRLGREREQLNVVCDQLGSPTYARDLADALMDIVVAAESDHFIAGIYNYSNEGICSWYDFTRKIHELAGISTCEVSPIESKDYPAKVKRPAYSVLSKEKIKADYDIYIPAWEESLADCIKRLS
jgi:dTDP-4-dehydrorhamnose reductase